MVPFKMEERRKPSSFTRHSTGAPLAFTTTLVGGRRQSKERSQEERESDYVHVQLGSVYTDYYVFLILRCFSAADLQVCSVHSVNDGWYQTLARSVLNIRNITHAQHPHYLVDPVIHLAQCFIQRLNVNKISLKDKIKEWLLCGELV